MKRFVVLNPNTTVAMTNAVVARMAPLLPGAVLHGLTAPHGPPVIDSRGSFAVGAVSAVDLLGDVPAGTDAVLLACFGDPGLAEMRARCAVPVVGLAEAAILEAVSGGRRFAIVTAGAAWVPMLRECVAGYGAAGLLVDVFALDGNGADLRRDPAFYGAAVGGFAARALGEGAEVLILGGAAFAGLEFVLPDGVVLIDVFEAAGRRLAKVGFASHPRLGPASR